MKIFLMIVIMMTAGYLPLWRYATPALRRHIGWPFYFGAMSIIFVAAFSPSVLLALGWCVIVPNIRTGNRIDIACRYVLLAPLVPSMAPLLSVGDHQLGAYALIDMLGIGTVIATLRRPARTGNAARHRQFTAEDGLVLILFLVFSVGATRFDSVSLLIRFLLSQTLVLAMPYWILRANLRTRQDLQLLIGCLTVPGAMIAVIALYEAHAGWAIFDGIESRFAGEAHLAKSSVVRGGALRAAATLDTAIECGFFLMLSFLAMLSSRPFFRSPAVWLGATALLLLGMYSSQSRGAILGLAAGILIMLLARRRFFWAFVAACVGGLGALGLAAMSRTPGRVSALLDPHGDTADYRSILLRRGLQEGRKFPLLGSSYDSVLDRLRDITQGEHIIDMVNTYLHIFLISGLIGLGACVVAILFIYRDLVLVAMRSRERKIQMGAAFFISSVSAMLMSLATVSFYGRMPWFLMFLTASARVLGLSRDGRQQNPPAERNEPLRMSPA